MILEQKIYDLAISEGFSPSSAKLIVAQSKLESTNYTSSVFRNNNNMFGMKYVGQPLAQRGSLAPANERSDSCKSGGACVDRDFYAKYNSPLDSAKDVLQRLYKKTRNGIGFNELKDVKDADDFSKKLKTRNYFGFYDINTSQGIREAQEYANLLSSKLKTFSVKEVSQNKNELIVYGLVLIGVTSLAYLYYRKNYS
jgi:hypothetical protein